MIAPKLYKSLALPLHTGSLKATPKDTQLTSMNHGGRGKKERGTRGNSTRTS